MRYSNRLSVDRDSFASEPAQCVVLMEQLEDRCLMSVGPTAHVGEAVTAASKLAVRVSVAAKPAAKPSTFSQWSQSFIIAGGPTRGIRTAFVDCTGNWTGIFVTDSTGKGIPFSVRFISQKGEAIVGDFKLGKIAGVSSFRTTANLDAKGCFRVFFTGGKILGGMTGQISSDGKYIIGRWTFNNATTGWQTGIFKLSRVIPAAASSLNAK